MDSLGNKSNFGSAPYADLWNFNSIMRDPGAAPLTSFSPQVQALIDKGTISRSDRSGINESGEFRIIQDTVDWSDPTLPKVGPPGANTKFNWVPLDAGDTERKGLLDPTLVYNDPNYGQLTPAYNLKVDRSDWMDLIGPLAMAAITFGAGALAGGAAVAGSAAAGTASSVPWYINSGLSVARQVGSGNPSALGIGSALLPGLSEFGIPKEVLSGASLATSAFKSNNASSPTPRPFYDPSLFGDMGSMANSPAVSDGSQRVATAVAPDAYGNSYNQVIS